MNATTEELTQKITTTQMPDKDYPAFAMYKDTGNVEAKFSWRGLEVAVIGEDEDDVVREAAVNFMIITAILFSLAKEPNTKEEKA